MHVVVIGGGSGLFQAIKAVRPIAQRISVIVPTCGDDGADALIRRLGPYPGVAGVVNVLLQVSRDAAIQRLMQQLSKYRSLDQIKEDSPRFECQSSRLACFHTEEGYRYRLETENLES